MMCYGLGSLLDDETEESTQSKTVYETTATSRRIARWQCAFLVCLHQKLVSKVYKRVFLGSK